MFRAAENQDVGVPTYNLAAYYHGSEAAAPVSFCFTARSISSKEKQRISLCFIYVAIIPWILLS